MTSETVVILMDVVERKHLWRRVVVWRVDRFRVKRRSGWVLSIVYVFYGVVGELLGWLNICSCGGGILRIWGLVCAAEGGFVTFVEFRVTGSDVAVTCG